MTRAVRASTLRDAETTGTASVKVGNFPLARFLGYYLELGRRSYPLRVDLEQTEKGVSVLVSSRDTWAAYRIAKEQDVFADRVAAVRSVITA